MTLFTTPTLCKYPECKAVAKKTWSYVPLCAGHHTTIRIETLNYYANKFGYQYRQHYLQIKPMVEEALRAYRHGPVSIDVFKGGGRR